MSLLIVAAVVVSYVCFITFVMALLMTAKRADTEAASAHRRLHRRRARWDHRRVAEVEERPVELSGRR